MARHIGKPVRKSHPWSGIRDWGSFKNVAEWSRRLDNAQDLETAKLVALALLAFEAILCLLIVKKVPYTEIDWTAYMEQVQGFMKGERDYKELRGGTGPLVYPAGFLYVYSIFYHISNGEILPAQVIFVVLYMLNLALVLWIYIQAKAVPPWALILLALSKRVHSIYMLRLFNDGVAMFIAYGATAMMLKEHWVFAIVSFSLAVSVKMNILLMAPPVLVILLKVATFQQIIVGSVGGVLLQLLLGLPFLMQHPASYLSRAFELSRIFTHRWTVNLKFLPESAFQSKYLAVFLLSAHLLLLYLFASCRWCKTEGGLIKVIEGTWQRSTAIKKKITVRHVRAEHLLLVLFTGNFIGIVCARTLHFQFYSWYFHMIPFLLWQVDVHPILRLALWVGIELVWNIYPTTATSSLFLLALHLGILSGLWFRPKPAQVYEKMPARSGKK
eukprot:jgi/Botrbrau1/22783/Bobra.0132s0109.1